MLKKILKNKIGIVLIGFLVLLLACIRNFEDFLFYDPFLVYYKSNYQALAFPDFDKCKLFLGLFFRYILNTIASLVIIYLVFKDFKMIKFASFLYFVFFIILIIVLFTLLSFNENGSKMTVFYVRRFVIQPVFLMLFLPAFYFQKKESKQ